MIEEIVRQDDQEEEVSQFRSALQGDFQSNLEDRESEVIVDRDDKVEDQMEDESFKLSEYEQF